MLLEMLFAWSVRVTYEMSDLEEFLAIFVDFLQHAYIVRFHRGQWGFKKKFCELKEWPIGPKFCTYAKGDSV